MHEYIEQLSFMNIHEFYLCYKNVTIVYSYSPGTTTIVAVAAVKGGSKES